MTELKITVRNKRASGTSGTGTIVCGNSDYKVIWDLDGEWAPFNTKTMRVQLPNGSHQDVVFSGDSAALPVQHAAGWISIGLFAGDIHTSRGTSFWVEDAITTIGGPPADPMPGVYDQIMELIKGLGSANTEAIKTAVAEYLTAHPIEETDPTVPAWAKAEKKPAYTAAEVGAIAQTDLQAATDAALAQAKASGAFDGAKGDPGSDASVTAANIAAALGYTPVKASDIPTNEITANTQARHSHSNKTTLDKISSLVEVDSSGRLSGEGSNSIVTLEGLEAVAAQFQQLIPTVPDALKNPNALTIKIGSTTVTYDGSSAQTVEIADGTEVSY